MNKNKFATELEIDRHKLGIECERHPSLYYYYAELQADAKAKKDAESDKLKLVLSEVELELRADPPQGIKITEAVMKALVINNQLVMQQEATVQQCKSNLYHLDAAVNAIEHRKSKLNNLVQLFSVGYFSKPEENVNNSGLDVIQEELNNGLNRRK